MAVFLDTPVNISPATTGSWQTLDLDSYIAGLPDDLSGVMLKFVTTSSVALGARPTGSSDNRTTANYYSGASLYSGCDSSHQIDVYRGSTAVTVYVVGYFTTDAVFFTNAYDKSPSTTSAWVDIDCSAEIPAGAVAAIFDIKSAGTSGLRNNGSTDDRRTGTSVRSGAIVGIDAGRICEFNTTVASGTLYLVGYLTQGIFKTNGVDVSIATTASYVDINLSADGDSATASCAVIEVKSSLDTYYGLRTNGTTGDIYLKHQSKEWGVTGLDANKVFEGKINHISVDFFVIGYLVTPSGGGTTITAAIATLQAAQSQTASGKLLFSLSGAESQALQTQATTCKLAFNGSSTTTQQPQTSTLSALLSFKATTAEMQSANLQAIVASLSFSGNIDQIQQAQQQAIYQSLQAISGAVSQTQAAQISSLTASLIFGGTSSQTQAVQAEALAAVLRFTGSAEQAQAVQEQAIIAILGEVAITGTVSQTQAIQLATLSAALKFSASVDQSQAAQTQILREFISAIITGYGIPVSVAMPQPLRVSAPLPQHTSINVALRLPPATITAGLV